MTQPSSQHFTTSPTLGTERTQDGNRMSAIQLSAVAVTTTPSATHLRRLKMRKHRIQAPDGRDVHQRNGFSEPRLSNFSIYKKALNSLT